LAIENLAAVAGRQVEASFYGTSGGEIDLVLGRPDGTKWAVEIKPSLAPKLERGFHSALEDLQPERSFVVYPGHERYKMGASTEAISLSELCEELE